MDGVLGKVELTPLPEGAWEHGLARGAEAGMIVAGDRGDAAQPPGHQAIQEGAPMDLSFRGIGGDAENAPCSIGIDADRGEDGDVAHHATFALLFVAGIDEQVPELAQRPGAPGVEFGVEKLGGAADLGRGQALEAKLGQHRLDVTGRGALHIHLGHGQHDGARRAPTALQRGGVERRLRAGGLGHFQGQGSGWGIDLLGLVAVGIAAPLGRAFVMGGAEESLAFEAHGQIEQAGEHFGHAVRALRNKLCHQRGDRRIL